MNEPLALEISDLRFRYSGAATNREGEAAYTLELPSLRLSKAEQVLLTGGSGTGKSTLLQLIAGLMDPASGAVNVNGVRVHSLRGAARDAFRGKHIGMIFQTFNLLLGFSAAENVMAALLFSSVAPSTHAARAKELLDMLGISRHGALVEEMSVGQQQRVAVARALACHPVLVLADEPTASLDPENSDAAMELVQTACRESGAALLCVSHDPSMHARFSRVEQLARLRAGNEERAR